MKTLITGSAWLLLGYVVCSLLFAVVWYVILLNLGVEFDYLMLFNLGCGSTTFLIICFGAHSAVKLFEFWYVELPAKVAELEARQRIAEMHRGGPVDRSEVSA